MQWASLNQRVLIYVHVEIKGVLQEIWMNDTQIHNLSSLLEHHDFPERPHWSGVINSFNSNLTRELSGQRLRAYVTVPKSGFYSFHVSCNRSCALSFKAEGVNTYVRCKNK